MSREADQRALAEARKREQAGQTEGFVAEGKGTLMQGYRPVRGAKGLFDGSRQRMFDGSRAAGGAAKERDGQGRIL